jgi:hypothetical protein
VLGDCGSSECIGSYTAEREACAKSRLEDVLLLLLLLPLLLLLWSVLPPSLLLFPLPLLL